MKSKILLAILAFTFSTVSQSQIYGGGGSGLTIGNVVTGGGANRVLYEDASQTLGANSAFLFDVGNTRLQMPTGYSIYDNNNKWEIGGTNGSLLMTSLSVVGWAVGNNRGTSDSGISRTGIATLTVGNGTQANSDGTIKASKHVSVQTTPPVCSTNCGTSPTVVGGDSAMRVTLGTTPASGFLITFNSTFGAAPACSGTMGTAGMVVGKFPVTMVTTATTVTVVTNGTAPATGDIYNILCTGVQ